MRYESPMLVELGKADRMIEAFNIDGDGEPPFHTGDPTYTTGNMIPAYKSEFDED